MFGGLEQIFSNINVVTLSWLRLTVDSVAELLWVLFYCRVSQKYPVKLPLREWLITVLPLVISAIAMFFIQEAIVIFMENGTSIIGLSLGMSIFLLAYQPSRQQRGKSGIAAVIGGNAGSGAN